MSAKQQQAVVTTVECDAGGCTAKASGFGNAKQAREALNKQGWKCSDKARTDMCPEHAK